MIISKKCPNCSEISTQDVSTTNCPVCGVFYAKRGRVTEPNIGPVPEQAQRIATSANTMRKKGMDEKFCTECGSIIRIKAEICPSCGVRQPALEGFISGIPNQRKCLSCGHTGIMQTWLRNNNMPQLIALIGLMFWVFPGLIFIAWAWGKYKCPKCEKVGENVPA